MLTPMPPRSDAPGAMPLVFNAALVGLSARHEVTLVTVAGPDPEELEAVDRLLGAGFEVHAVRRAQPEGLRRWQRRWRLGSRWLRGREPWRSIWFWEPGVQRIFDRLLAHERFDIVAADDNAMGIYRYPSDLPKVLTEHEVRRPRSRVWRLGPLREWPQRAFREVNWHRWPAYHRSVWRRFDRVQVFTERDAETLRMLAPDVTPRVRVNPFGVELPPPFDPAREEPGRLLFVGNFTHPPNTDAALWLGNEIMPRLRQRKARVNLTIVGIHASPRVRALARDDIRLAGHVADLGHLLERAALVVAPVRIGGGMRMKVLHSMAAGKAVVTTPRGADGLAVDGQQLPVAIGSDADALADAITALLADDSARRALADGARAFVAAHFSPDAYARRLEAVYDEAMRARGAA